MKKLFLFITLIASLSLLCCKKEKQGDYIENITKGEKWGVKIGSNHSEVFSQLQIANSIYQFDKISIVYRKPFVTLDELQKLLPFYNSITLSTSSGTTNRAIISFINDKVNEINLGGALPKPVIKWPENATDDVAIHINDPVESLFAKLVGISKLKEYSSYSLLLPDKPLNKAYDSDMSNYEEWAFSFFLSVKNGISGRSSVRLYFSKGKLVKIRHQYENVQYVN